MISPGSLFSCPRFLFLAISLTLCGFAYSHDNWIDRSSQITGGSSNRNTGIAYNGSHFIMVTTSPSTFWKSAAGTSNWTSSTFTFPATVNSALSISHGASATVVAGGNNVVMRTTAANPVTADWTGQRPVTRPNATHPTLYRVRYLNGRFFICTNFYSDAVTPANSYTELISSADGLTWNSHKFAANTITNQQTTNQVFPLHDVAFKPGATVGTGTYVFTTNTDSVIVSPESLASASRVVTSIAGHATSVIVYGSNVFVAIGNTGKIFTSPTGATSSWTERSTPINSSSWNDLFHDGERFVLVGNTVTGSSPARPAILHSTDGVNWTEATTVPNLSPSLNCVFLADGLWLAGGSTRTLITSGSASVSAPGFSPQPVAFSGSVGGTITLTATITGTPAATLQWFRNDTTPTALVDSARVSGATTNTLTITGATFADAKGYYLAATNSVGTTHSNVALVSLNAAAGGAVLTPYGITNSLGGKLLPGSSPAASLIGGATGRFTVGTGFTGLPNSTVNGVAYGFFAGLSPDGTRAVINPLVTSTNPPLVYNLLAGTGVQLPLPTLPLGPITSYSLFNAIDVADNGNVIGQFLGQDGVTRGYYYTAVTQTYTLLGNVPNANNDAATNPASISADGAIVTGYERISVFNGPFLWTNGEFTILPQPINGGAPNGDIRELSPNARYAVGYGAAATAHGSGSVAMRWDRSALLGAPVGFALPRRAIDIFGDALTVNDDGTSGGTVRQGNSAADNRAAVWLPNGALAVLPDYLQTTYGLDLTGITLTFVTSISNDRRTLSGNARLADGTTDGWILTLPAPIDLPVTPPEITVRQDFTTLTNASTVSIGTRMIGTNISGSGGYVQKTFFVRNDGMEPLTGITAAITGTDAVDFTLAYDAGLSAVPTTLGLNGIATFYVRFAPLSGSAGTRTASLTITSNDSDESVFTLALNGDAIPLTAQTAFQVYLINANVPANSRGILDDPDGDGIANLLEFALGLAPLTPDAKEATRIALGNGVLSLSYTRAQPLYVAYTVRTTTTLSPDPMWTTTDVDQGIPDLNGRTVASTPFTSDPTRFLRLEVSLVP